MAQKVVKWRVQFPEGERITTFARPSLRAVCYGNERIAALMNYFIYEASVEAERLGLGEGCEVVKLSRKHDEILSKFNLSEKTLIRYLSILNTWEYVTSEPYKRIYTINLSKIQEAISTPPTPAPRQSRNREKGCKVVDLQPSKTETDLAQKVVDLQLKVVDLQEKVVKLQEKVDIFTTLQPLLEALESRGLEALFAAPRLVDYIDCNKTVMETEASAASAAPTVPSIPSKVKKVVTPKPSPQKKTGIDLLPDDQRRFWSLWLNVDQNRKVPPALNDTAKEHITALAGCMETQEQLDSLITFTRQQLREKTRKPRLWRVELGNLRSCFSDWDHQRQTSKPTPAPDTASQDEERLVLWSRHVNDSHFKCDKTAWYLFEEMPLSLARQYDHDDWGGLPSNVRQDIRFMLQQEKEGKIARPTLVVAI